MSAADVITCSIDKQYPHKSTHDSSTVNVVAVVTCTAPVVSIGLQVALYMNGPVVADSGWNDFMNTAVAQVDAAAPCINATYNSWRQFGITFPPGYVPETAFWPSDVNDGFGAWVEVTNC